MAFSNWHFLNIRKARAEMDRLAQEAASLGQPQPEWNGHNIGKANAEIVRLRGLLKTARAAVPSTPATTPLAPAHKQQKLECHPPVAGTCAGAEISSAPQTPPPGPPPAISRAALNQIAALFPAVEADVGIAGGDLLARVEQAAYEAHLRFPGMRPDADLAALFTREDPAVAIYGLRRTLRAMRQERIDSIVAASGAGHAPQRNLTASVRSAVHAAVPAAVPILTAVGRPVRSELERIAKVLDVDVARSMPDDQVFALLEKVAFARCFRFAGMAAEDVLATQYRRVAAEKVIGAMGAVLHTMRQQELDSIVKPK